MRTPKIYTDNLKKGIITKEMLAECLFSVNKRAKNCRDKEATYRCRKYDNYNNEQKYRNEKEKYYNQKEVLLTLLQPTCIHVEHATRKERVYDFEHDYYRCLEEERCIHYGKYFDREIHDYVEFVDIEIPDIRMYLFYDLGKFSFHKPLNEKEALSYQGLEKKEIETIVSNGRDVIELISTNFVNKVLDLINTKTYTLVFEE